MPIMYRNMMTGRTISAPDTRLHGAARRGKRGDPARGQILIVLLLAMTLLVGLIFYVLNMGVQANRRLDTQDTADAVAVSGGGWIARTLNLVAMNNVASSRLLAMVPIMDALPLSVQMSAEELAAWKEAINAQLARGVPEEYLKRGLESLSERMGRQSDILAAMNNSLNQSGFEMDQTTHWAYRGGGGAPPNGKLWKAVTTLDEFSQSAIESAGILAQADAVRFGKSNLTDMAFLVPIVPRPPARRGEFRDYQPTLQGREHVYSNRATLRYTGGRGGAIPDMQWPHRLGPWARLYRWRYPIYRTIVTGREWVPGQPGPQVRGNRGNVNVGGRRVGASAKQRGGGRPGHWRTVTDRKHIGYGTEGPYHWAMERIDWWAQDHGQHHRGKLPDTYFYNYMHEISGIKLGYMFGSQSLRSIHYPQWIGDYPTALQMAQRDDVRIDRTMFYLVEIVSSVPESSPDWLSHGTYYTNGEYPISIWTSNWNDPAKWGIPKVSDYVWKDSYTYQTTYDHRIGLRKQIDPMTGEPLFQDVYVVAWYVFGGVDIGAEVEIDNPCNWDSYDALPAPTLLDTSVGDYDPGPAPEYRSDPDEGYRREYFTYLGVGGAGDQAMVWSSQFTNPNPSEQIVAVAQSKVFNHSSFDLWTQDWQVTLMPVSKWRDWAWRLDEGSGNIHEVGYLVTYDELRRVYDYMSAMNEDLAETYLKH